MNKIIKILKKFWITRYLLGLASAFKFIFVNKKFNKPKGVSCFYIINDFAYYYAKSLIEKNEYFFLYEFYKYKRFEKNKYLTRNEFAKTERKLSKDIRDIFWNKEKFLEKFSEFIKRDWIDFDNCTEEELKDFIEKNKKIIVKPKCGSLGNGIEVIDTDSIKNKTEFVSNYINSSKIAEECVNGNKEIAEFHPNSLNTIRVVTFYNGEKFIPFGAFIRIGNNNQVIDNAHAGGIFATIDIKTGVVVSRGITTSGENYIVHPYLGKQIIGFKIPKWEEIIETCEKASKHLPNIKVAGWDIAINDKDEVIIIEANHMPDFDVMQGPLKKGVKVEIKKILKDLYNFDLK